MKPTIAAAAACLVEGRTYTFAELAEIGGAGLADHARRLAGVQVQAPARTRAPRRAAAGSSAKIPRRADLASGRLGDRLARS